MNQLQANKASENLVLPISIPFTNQAQWEYYYYI